MIIVLNGARRAFTPTDRLVVLNLHLEHFDRVTTPVLKAAVLDDRQFRVTKISVVSPIIWDIEIRAEARLFIDTSASSAQRAAIVSEWGAFGSTNDIDDIEDRLTANGVPRKMYLADLCAIYRASYAKRDNSRLDFVNAECSALGWTLVPYKRRECSCVLPTVDTTPPEKRYDGTEDPTPGQLEPNIPSDCSEFTTAKVDLVKARFNGLPDFRVVMVDVVIEVGRCLRVVVSLPEFQIRDVETEVHLYVIAPAPTVAQTQKSIENCINNSAVVAAFAFLISGGQFAAASVAFELSMKACLANVIVDSVAKCVKSGIYLKENRKIWRKL